jgi:hypothetical protein
MLLMVGLDCQVSLAEVWKLLSAEAQARIARLSNRALRWQREAKVPRFLAPSRFLYKQSLSPDLWETLFELF